MVKISHTCSCVLCVTPLSLLRFDIIWDILMNRCAPKWNLFVNWWLSIFFFFFAVTFVFYLCLFVSFFFFESKLKLNLICNSSVV